VHLSREPDAGNVIGPQIGGLKRLADRQSASAPPVARILLGPAGPWADERIVFFRSGSDDLSGLVNDESPRAAGADVDAEIRDAASSMLMFASRTLRLSEIFRQDAGCFLGLSDFVFIFR